MAATTTNLETQRQAGWPGSNALNTAWSRIKHTRLPARSRARTRNAAYERAELARLTGSYRGAGADPSESMSDIIRTARYSL